MSSHTAIVVHLLLLHFISNMQVEFQHRLLAFLSAASRAPLSTQYSGSGLVEALEEQVGAGESVNCLPCAFAEHPVLCGGGLVEALEEQVGAGESADRQTLCAT